MMDMVPIRVGDIVVVIVVVVVVAVIVARVDVVDLVREAFGTAVIAAAVLVTSVSEFENFAG